MVSIRQKNIKGKNYLYAEYSFRLPDSTIKKISKLVKEKEAVYNKDIKEYFRSKEKEAYQTAAKEKFKPDTVLTKDKIESIEAMRIEYKILLKNITENQWKDILDRFTVNFTYESNAIEGNSLTLKDVTLLLHENILPNSKNLREIYETRNTRTANELLFNNKIKITIEGMLSLHSILIKDTGVKEGFKQLPNFLMLRNVKTTPPEKVQEEMDKLISWYEANKNKEHPLRLAAEFHGRFEKIHPFEDGNGRVGRILINAILLENGYPPIIIRKTTRTPYFASLEAFDNGYSLKLERFLLEKFENTFEDFFKEYLKYI